MQTSTAQNAETVRQFNRFYTRQIGLLNEHLSSGPFSLSEARVLYELAHAPETTAANLIRILGLDAGYLSRILRSFEKRGLIEKNPSQSDGRQSLIRLTEAGSRAFSVINANAHTEIEGMLAHLADEDQQRLVTAMQTITTILSPLDEEKVAYIIRPPHPGDLGWVVYRHGVLYAQEYHWDEHFEALIAEIVAAYVQNFNPRLENCWIAEKDGEVVGSIFIVRKSDEVAKLRLLWVEPRARGLGIASRLVEESIRFARQADYRKITLWTNSILSAARHIYKKAGFRLVAEEPHHSYGQDLVSETWELDLD